MTPTSTANASARLHFRDLWKTCVKPSAMRVMTRSITLPIDLLFCVNNGSIRGNGRGDVLPHSILHSPGGAFKWLCQFELREKFRWESHISARSHSQVGLDGSWEGSFPLLILPSGFRSFGGRNGWLWFEPIEDKSWAFNWPWEWMHAGDPQGSWPSSNRMLLTSSFSTIQSTTKKRNPKYFVYSQTEEKIAVNTWVASRRPFQIKEEDAETKMLNKQILTNQLKRPENTVIFLPNQRDAI